MHDIAKEFAATERSPTPVVMDDYNSDWDSLYPFSSVRSIHCMITTSSHYYEFGWYDVVLISVQGPAGC